MNDTLLDYDPNDTGDIPLVGEKTRIIITAADRERLIGEGNTGTDDGEKTQRIDPRLIKAPSFDAIPRREVIEPDDTVVYLPQTIGVVGFDGPQNPPPPLPRPPAKLDPETGVNIFGGLGADLPEDSDAFRPGDYVGRHRHPEDLDVVPDGRYWEMQRPARERRLSTWWALAAVVVAGLAIWAMAAAAVFR